MDNTLLKIIRCPLCNDKLDFSQSNNELICKNSLLAYPIVDGIPVLIESQARKINTTQEN